VACHWCVVIPAKHSSACVLCTVDADAVCWWWSPSLLPLLYHTVTMCQCSRFDWLEKGFFCAKIKASATDIRDSSTGLDWHYWCTRERVRERCRRVKFVTKSQELFLHQRRRFSQMQIVNCALLFLLCSQPWQDDTLLNISRMLHRVDLMCHRRETCVVDSMYAVYWAELKQLSRARWLGS